MSKTRLMVRIVILMMICAAHSPVEAKIVTRNIAYADGETQLEGCYTYDDAVAGKRPGVLVVHAWWGLGDDEKARARQLAEMGYAVFALDMYGKGKFTSDPAQAQQWAGAFYQDRQLARTRAAAGLNVLTSQAEVDASRVAAVGYCFGGSIVVDLAYSGAALQGVVSFHGGPLPALEGDAARTTAKLLICHGAADPLVPMSSIDAFTDSLAGSPVDWQIVIYSGAQHSFTTPGVDRMNIPGAAYNAVADRRSWNQMREFFEEIFAP